MIHAIIIDDERDARESLALLIEKYCPDIKLLSLCATPGSGIESIEKLQPDLVFLDVQMPRMSGFDVLEEIKSIDFDIIFVTAHDKYAIQAIKFSALDYLLKPVEVDELIGAVEKTKKKREHRIHRFQSLLHNVRQEPEKRTRLAIPTDNEIVVEKIESIIYCAADGNYTTLHLADGKRITVSKTLKEFENMLPSSDFCRIHHASLVNLAHVTKYVRGEGGYVLVTGGHHLDVSRRKKENLLRALGQT